VAVFDYDEDGRLDLLVTSMFGLSQLYRNEPSGGFRDVTDQTLVRTTFGAIGSKVFDINNDGRLDIYIVDMHSDMWLPADPQLFLVDEKARYDHFSGPTWDLDDEAMAQDKLLMDLFDTDHETVLFGNSLFENQGAGRFVEVAVRANMETFWPWGIATGDFDNDGHEDAFLASGMGYPFPYWPNRLMMNDGDGTFTERSAELGIEPPREGSHLPEPIGGRPATRSSRCAAAGDFDRDGRLDLVVNNFNDRPYYFRNHFPAKNYVAFRLTGTRCNRDAVGAVVTLFLDGQVMARQVHAAGGYLSQSSKTLHFGLGDRAAIDRAEVRWPGGEKQTIDGPAINVLHEITEP
jgi:hypothetical protein